MARAAGAGERPAASAGRVRRDAGKRARGTRGAHRVVPRPRRGRDRCGARRRPLRPSRRAAGGRHAGPARGGRPRGGDRPRVVAVVRGAEPPAEARARGSVHPPPPRPRPGVTLRSGPYPEPSQLDDGTTLFVDLTEEGSLTPYEQLLPPGVRHVRITIPDFGVPTEQH